MYDDAGTLVSGSFVDYLLPTAADTISFDIDHTTSPSTTNTLGTKGVGEAGTIASTPAVVNAIVDAVRHLGVNDIVMPCTPGAGVAGDQRGRRRWAPPTGAAMPHFDTDEPAAQHGRSRRSDPRTVRLPGPDLGRGGARGAGPARRRRQGDGRRPEPAAGAADAAERAGGRDRPRPDRRAARRPRRRRRHRHRRDDHARRRRLGPARGRARRPDHQGDRAPGRRADPAPRHLRRRARARRPRRRPRRAGAGARRGVRDRRAERDPHGRRRTTSSSTCSRPPSATTSC